MKPFSTFRASALLGALFLSAPTVLFAANTPPPATAAEPAAEPAAQASNVEEARTLTRAELREQYGIEVQGIRPSAAGYMLDFRYKVVDAEKAATLINPKLRPHLIDERRHITLITPAPPKVGPLRQTRGTPREGRSYFIFFANPGKGVHSGDPVAIALGDITLGGLTVQ